LRAALLYPPSALPSPENAVQALSQADGSQFAADLTTIKSLAESLLARSDQSSTGTASDPHQTPAAGSVGQTDQPQKWIDHLSKHD